MTKIPKFPQKFAARDALELAKDGGAQNDENHRLKVVFSESEALERRAGRKIRLEAKNFAGGEVR